MAGQARYLDPAIVARLGTIDLKAKTIVEGFLTGLHRSPFKGFSVEFAEYRQYLPGDDLATLDWKIYARTDRHVVKKFEEETNVECHILLDVSRSMGYGSHAVSKIEYGSYLAGALAYLMNRQRDAVGLLTFDDRIRELLPCSARPGHLKTLLLALERVSLGVGTDIAKPLADLVQAIRKRGLVVLISDLLDDPDRIIEGLKHFRYRGTDVVVFQVLDPHEISFPFDRAARFRDVESDQEIVAVPAAIRDTYKARLEAMVSNFRTVLGQNGIDYTLLDTSQPLEMALLAYLQTRRRAL
ncbi:MAG TPA: DUF58 domain-containing protein [Vicinamibacterales bacterium]|nr:DUF58 domain-containing protein [Vicinamibacterales bacterium]